MGVLRGRRNDGGGGSSGSDDAVVTGRALRRWRRGALLAAGVSMGLVVPQIAGAITSPYPDVPTDHPFAVDIWWAKNLGIVSGYSDGTYRPGNPVTRGSMTSFLRRLYNVQEMTAAASSVDHHWTSSTSWLDLPGSTVMVESPTGVSVVVYALFTAESACYGTGGQWCEVRLQVDPPGATGWMDMAPSNDDAAFDDATPAPVYESHAVQGFLSDYGPGVYQVKVQYRVVDAADTFWLDDWMLRVDTDLMSS